MVSHVGGDLALVALILQLLDLAGGLDVLVLEEGKRALLVLVLDLLGLGVDLLLSLPLATIEGNESVNSALSLEAGLLEGQRLVESSSAAHEPVDGEVNLLLNTRSKQSYKHGSGNLHAAAEDYSESCLLEKQE